MFERDFAPFAAAAFAVKTATEPWERSAARALRRRVFCDEQRMFARSDADAADAIATTIVAIEEMMGMPNRVVGTVRIHTAGDRRWYGSRLAIEREYRHVHGIGSALVARAVGTALAAGCTEFLANVQRPNVPLFERLGWYVERELDVYGRPHAAMKADLACYLPCSESDAAAIVRSRRAS